MLLKLFFLLFSVTSSKVPDTLKGIEIAQLFPVLDSTLHMRGHDTSIMRVYYFDQMSVWQLPVWLTQENKIRYKYFISENDSAFGYMYEQRKWSGLNKIRMSKTDFINGETWVKYISGYKIFQENVMTLLKSNVDSSTGELNEVYTGYSKKDTAGKGTCYYTYTNQMKHIPFSLSPQLDSIKQMKLTRIRIVSHPGYNKEHHVAMGEIDCIYTLKEITASKGHEVFSFIEQYQQDVGKY